mmetsp:Transcript_17568/g.24129  ORF Transcript_17568/g.24129 Transcript_17568/m.24129 type:complete len:229 (+) Transcript_17568:1520-2206(+)
MDYATANQTICRLSEYSDNTCFELRICSHSFQKVHPFIDSILPCICPSVCACSTSPSLTFSEAGMVQNLNRSGPTVCSGVMYHSSLPSSLHSKWEDSISYLFIYAMRTLSCRVVGSFVSSLPHSLASYLPTYFIYRVEIRIWCAFLSFFLSFFVSMQMYRMNTCDRDLSVQWPAVAECSLKGYIDGMHAWMAGWSIDGRTDWWPTWTCRWDSLRIVRLPHCLGISKGL